MRWDWLGRNVDVLVEALLQHVRITAIALLLGTALSFPIGLAGYRWRRAYGPILAATQVLYTIPSLALFALLVPFTGLSRTTAEVGLVAYTLLILVRNILAGLEGVPDDVREAAHGMGYRPAGRLLRVELPLAVPVIVAGIRIATVTTIGLVTVTGLIGQGGLGAFIIEGINRDFRTPLVVGSVCSVALAVVADVLLAGAARLLAPWSRP